MSFLVDPSGRWWRWPSETLAEKLGYPDPDFDLAGYAARNLGYVWVMVQDDVTFLQFRAGTMTPATVNSLTSFLDKAIQKSPVALIFYSAGWMEEIYIDPERLTERMHELATLAEARVRDKYISKRLPLEYPTPLLKSQPLAELFALWRSSAGIYTPSVVEYLQNSELVNRTVMMQNGPDRGLKVIYTGNGFTVYDNFSYNKFVGLRLTDQPDRDYGRWAEQAYAECLERRTPACEDVDAIVEQSGHDSRRRRYRRLLLPWRMADGTPAVTGTSLLNVHLTIPLDLKGLQE